MENDLDENIDLPIRMTRLAIELNKFRNLKTLILKGNRLSHFNLPKRYLTYKQIARTSNPYGPNLNTEYTTGISGKIQYTTHNRHNLTFNYKNYKEYNRLANQNNENRKFNLNNNPNDKVEVFPELVLLDISENKIEIIPPNAFKLLPKLMHLNLMSNGIKQIYGRSFIFTNNQTELDQNLDTEEAIITDLDRIFDQNIDEYLKNKSIISRPKQPDEYYNYGTFSFENKTLQSNSTNDNDNLDNIVNIYLG